MSEAPRFHLPEAAHVAPVTMADGARIRTLRLPHPRPVANLLLLTGRADFLEKWADAIAALHGLGLSIASFDWRGQGGSDRLTQKGSGHIDSFDRWLADLDQLAGHAVETMPDAPWLTLGHSMGGHLLSRWIAEPARHGHPLRHPLRQRLKGAVLSSPLHGINMAQPLRAIALRMAARRVRQGRGDDFAWGQGPYGATQQSAARQALLTHDDARFEDEARWIAMCPGLATGGVSWGWLQAFAESEDRLEHLPLESLDLPVLMLLAGEERLVDNDHARAIAARLPRCRLELVPDGAHELLREADRQRQMALSKIRDFILDCVA